MFAEEDKEVLDVVNDKDEIIGQISRKDIMLLKDRKNEYLHVIEIFLQRPNGDIYLPRRSPHKKIAPDGYDHSAAGHITSGESYDQACIREIKEELGIDIGKDDLTFITKIPPSPELFYFRMLYLLRTDKQPVLSSEHTDFSWIKPDELEKIVRDDVPTKETLYEDIPLLIEYLKEHPHE